ncbi:hypothetical protein HNY73_004044 [Argiope bruennichi]|uniref:Ig-like domain-containing protein n=1 Tax=Argiope bruennichi TaxID=94029 RepID=A0A8T0FPE9_ARGBR|nr:hypothetical protein HNY73_004044 [Argiope bruennichi]
MGFYAIFFYVFKCYNVTSLKEKETVWGTKYFMESEITHGKYTCLVTSLAGQDSREQVMTVFVPANEFDLSYTELSDASVNVTCEAQGLFPPPVLKLYLGSSTGSPLQTVTDAVSVFKPKYSGAYDAFLYRTFSANELSKNGASSVFECFLELPGTNYARAKRIAYYPGIQGLRIDAAHSLSSISHRRTSHWILPAHGKARKRPNDACKMKLKALFPSGGFKSFGGKDDKISHHVTFV